MTTETTKNEENCDTSEDIVFDAMKEEYEHCVKRSEKLDNKIYILLTVCAFIFVLLTSIIEKASTFQMSQDMTKISLIIIYWLLLLVDVVIFCVLLEKLVVLLGSIEFQRLDINNIMELNERDRKGSIQTTQEVEIYFNFVGRFVPPAFGEVELTPEELEEIRKREERKDRLHQNYLKRKASGAQKRYEDKIKKRKKAEIEAKKAAIRAEDIAKGVFVPVSSLPQREPMKGVQTA